MAEVVAVLIGLLISAWPVLDELGYTYQGQHRPAPGRSLFAIEIRWPTGADEAWAEQLHEMAAAGSMRDEVKA